MLLIHKNTDAGNQQEQDMLSKKWDDHYMLLYACSILCLVNATIEIIIEMNVFYCCELRAKIVFSSL